MRSEIERFERILNNMVDQVGEEAVLDGVRYVRDHADPELLSRAKKLLVPEELTESMILESLGMLNENVAKKALNVLFPADMDVTVTDPLPLPVRSDELAGLLSNTNDMLKALTTALVDNFDQLDLSIDDLTAVTAGTSRSDVEAAQAAGHDVTDLSGRSPGEKNQEDSKRNQK